MSEIRNPKQILNTNKKLQNTKYEIQIRNPQSQIDHSDFRKMAAKISINSVLSWISPSRSASRAVFSCVSRSRSQYRVSFDSFREIRTCNRNSFSAQRFVGFDVVCPNRTGRTRDLLDVLDVADRMRKPLDEGPNAMGELVRSLLKVVGPTIAWIFRHWLFPYFLICLGFRISDFFPFCFGFRISDFGF